MTCQKTVVLIVTALNKRTGILVSILVSMQAIKAHGEVKDQLH